MPNSKNLFKTAFIVCTLLLAIPDLSAQNNNLFKKFCGLSRPEKCWVIAHPFIAKKIWKITQKVLEITDSISKISTLDGDKNGGQVDAFRHAYWMASLTKYMRGGKALRLCKAHERGNYLSV